jgi:hypothetical protein
MAQRRILSSILLVFETLAHTQIHIRPREVGTPEAALLLDGLLVAQPIGAPSRAYVERNSGF